jgi:hypothetical protein
MGGVPLSCQPARLTDTASDAAAEVGEPETDSDVNDSLKELTSTGGVLRGSTGKGPPYAPCGRKWGVFRDSPVTDGYYDRTRVNAQTYPLPSFGIRCALPDLYVDCKRLQICVQSRARRCESVPTCGTQLVSQRFGRWAARRH